MHILITDHELKKIQKKITGSMQKSSALTGNGKCSGNLRL